MPRRGEVWMVDLGMAQKTRPALVLSVGYSDDDRALVTVVSHTTSVRGSEFEISGPVPFLKPGAFIVQSSLHLSKTECDAGSDYDQVA